MLYQVATALIETSAVAHPLRDLFHDQPNAAVHQATATSIDLERRRVEFDQMAAIDYDYLVLGIGARVNFFGVEGADEHAFPMYTLTDAVRLKEHVLRRWEAADRDPSLVDDGALHIVVVGGGPTGVESVGALAELYRSDFAKDYPGLPTSEARLTLVEAGRACSRCSSRSFRNMRSGLSRAGGSRSCSPRSSSSVAPTRVTLKSGRELKAHTLVWGAGLQAHPLAEALGVELEHGNRIPVGPDLEPRRRTRRCSWSETSPGSRTPRPVTYCRSSVRWPCRRRARRGEHRPPLAGKETEPFAYHDKGTMATIGRGAAVIQLPRGRTVKGRTAFLAWGAVHLALLSTGEDRTKAMLDWAWAGFTHERGSRIVVGRARKGEPPPTRIDARRRRRARRMGPIRARHGRRDPGEIVHAEDSWRRSAAGARSPRCSSRDSRATAFS